MFVDASGIFYMLKARIGLIGSGMGSEKIFPNIYCYQFFTQNKLLILSMNAFSRHHN